MASGFQPEGCGCRAKSHASRAFRLKPEATGTVAVPRNSDDWFQDSGGRTADRCGERLERGRPGQQTDARAKAPARIISLVPAVTEMLFARRRGSAGRWRQQLRPFPAGGRAPASSGGAARSRRRTDPLAPAGSGRRLPQPDRRPGAAGTGRNPLVRVLARRAGGRHGNDAATRRANRVQYRRRKSWRRRSSGVSRRSAQPLPTPSGRKRWSYSDATHSPCAASTRAVASDSSTTW